MCISKPDDPLYQFVDKSSLDDSEKASLSEIILKYGDVFPQELPHGLPPARSVDHRINLIP